MAHLLLTVVGRDRAGIVQAVAEEVAAFDGSWVRSELAEVSGSFAGVILVEVAPQRREELADALTRLEASVTVTAHTVEQSPIASAPTAATITVLGDDRTGIVRDVARVLSASGLSVDRLTSRTMAAPMAGGELFEAVVGVHALADGDMDAAVRALEGLAGEIQVDVLLG